MRAAWTDAEETALHSLFNALAEQGLKPMYAEGVVDSPDALFLVEGHVVAIECRYVAHQKLLEFLGRRDLEENIGYEVIVPREPHLWVRDAIEEKTTKVDKYLANTGATEAWLLLHSSVFHPMLKGNAEDELFITLLKYGTSLIEHKFARIWFAEIGAQSRGVVQIYGPDTDKPSFNWDAYVKELSHYPVSRLSFAKVFVEDDGRAVVDLNNDRAKPIGLQPLDTNYKLDYTHLSEPLRNANRPFEYTYFTTRPKY